MVIPPKHVIASDSRKPERALISVSDKTGLVELLKQLVSYGISLISTGGTAQTILQENLPVQEVSDLANFPEIMDGRVKTLHPVIHAALLGIRDDAVHAAQMKKYGIIGIDLVIVNLYPFEEVCFSGVDNATVLENIDIGGPAMIRAAAKNHAYVAVITDPKDYELLLFELAKNSGQLSLDFRRDLAARAYARTAAYECAIAHWFSTLSEKTIPHHYAVFGHSSFPLRYGENPHQKAVFYRTGEKRPGVATAQLLQGKQLSYNNISDTDSAFELVAEFESNKVAAAVIVKHGNPCGVALEKALKDAYLKAFFCDPLSAFGGIVAFNCIIDEETAKEIVKNFTEVVIAPSITPQAQQILAHRKNIRILISGNMPDPREAGKIIRSVSGGLLVQTRDNSLFSEEELKIVTKRFPTKQEMEDLKFAFCVAKHVKSNAVVYVKNGMTVGIGAGQMSRLDSALLAGRKVDKRAGYCQSLQLHSSSGYVAASDAFFPFPDALIAVVEAGARAVLAPGGSMRDSEVITAADAKDISMVMTNIRHFRH